MVRSPFSRLDGEDNGIPPELGGHPILSRKTLPEQVDDHSQHAIVLAVARPLSGLRLLDQAPQADKEAIGLFDLD
jgi:hypothetical protein